MQVLTVFNVLKACLPSNNDGKKVYQLLMTRNQKCLNIYYFFEFPIFDYLFKFVDHLFLSSHPQQLFFNLTFLRRQMPSLDSTTT